MIEILKLVDHNTVDIDTSKYEQCNDIMCSKKYTKNKYVSLTKYISTVPKPVVEVKFTCISVFEQISHIMENSIPMDMLDYSTMFKKNVSDVLLKVVCKRHRVLKTDLFNFVDTGTFCIPSNPDVIKLFCVLLKSNIILVEGCVYRKYLLNEDKTYVINNLKVRSVFSSANEADEYLTRNSYYEHAIFEKMKLNELVMYAAKFKVDISKGKSKQDFVIILSEHLRLKTEMNTQYRQNERN